jgi:hypothetical protein
MTFAQRGTVAGNNGLMHDGITCYTCNNVGHYASNCPDDHQVNATTHQGTTLTPVRLHVDAGKRTRTGPELDPIGLTVHHICFSERIDVDQHPKKPTCTPSPHQWGAPRFGTW